MILRRIIKLCLISLILMMGCDSPQSAYAGIDLKETVEGGEKHSKALSRLVAGSGGVVAVGRTVMTGNFTALIVWVVAVIAYELVSLKIPDWFKMS